MLAAGRDYLCAKCGALYGAEGRCLMTQDDGVICRGAVRAQKPQKRSSGAATQPEQPPETDEGIFRGVVSMRRGESYPDGNCSAILMFKNSDERARFAELLLAAGGKVSA